jgi:hypothetical protein
LRLRLGKNKQLVIVFCQQRSLPSTYFYMGGEVLLEGANLAALTAVTDDNWPTGFLLACNYCEKTLFSFH